MIDDVVERLAQTIHERYLAEQAHNGIAIGSNPAMVAWADLDEDLRQANLAQARDIGAKLARIACTVGPADADEAPFAFTGTELETLARDEHSRWSEQRRAAGWSYGKVRDDRAKRHPSLVPWERLSEPERDKDRSAVLGIPSVLAAAGLRAFRRPGHGHAARDDDLVGLFAADAEGAVLRVLQRGDSALTAGQIKRALQSGGVARADIDQAWPKVQKRIRSHDQVAVDGGPRYRWTGRSGSASAQR
jgi:hypothetical protein